MAHGEARPVVPGANWGARTKGWLKFKPLKSKGEKAVALIAAALVSLLVFGLGGVRLFGVVPLAGRSMEPTFPAMSFWPHIAAYYQVDKGQTPEIGSLVELISPRGEVCVKRITRFSSDGSKVWVKGDNQGITTMDSEDYGWVPVKNVRGVARLWTPRRALHARTPEGRFENWLDDHEPGWALKSKASDYLIYEIDGTIDIVKKDECHRVARLHGQFVDWNNGVLVYRAGKSQLHNYDPRTGENEVIETKLTPVRSDEEVELIIRNSGQSFFGPTYVLVGKSLPKKARLRIDGVIYSLRSYREFDHDPLLGKPVSFFGLTPRDDSVPSGMVTATVVSEEP